MKKSYTEFIILSSIILIFSFLVFFKLGENHLSNWDEAWHADISRNVYKTGNLTTLYWNKHPFFDKPPLYFWLSAFAFRIFGENEFSPRFFSAFSGVGCGLLLYFLSRLLFNKNVAVLSLIVLCSTIGFLYRARTGNIDVLWGFWILFSIFSFYKGYLYRSTYWFILMGISIGLAFLTKGVVSFLFPAVAFMYLVYKKEYIENTFKYLLLGLMLGLIISCGWMMGSYLANGQAFIYDFFFNQTGKFSTKLFFWNNFSFDYIIYLKSGLKLWFLFFIPSLLFTVYKWRNNIYIVLVLYFLLIFLGLLFAENKSNWFLVPFYPITSLMIGFFLYEVNKLKIKYNFYFLLLFVLVFSIIQNYKYLHEYIVPDIVIDEAKVATEADKISEKDVVLYLTNYYFPTTVYYSKREVHAVYSQNTKGNAWWIEPVSDWQKILNKENVFIITTVDEFKQLQENFPAYKMEIIFRSGYKLLVKRV